MIAQAAPAGSDTLVMAVQWVQGVMTGSVATVVAVIAVAMTGAMMLNGRIDWRRGATVIIGCFIIFGAPAIAAGLAGVMTGDVGPVPPAVPFTPILSAPAPAPARPAAPPAGYDPYAGAAMPPAR
jgi:type IV secretory pathway VirB2 component (pilin)